MTRITGCYHIPMEASNENMISVNEVKQFPYFEFLKGGQPWKEKKVRV